MLDYFMTFEYRDALMVNLMDRSMSTMAFETIVLISVLAAFKSYEIANPYLKALSEIVDESLLKVP
jgi:hypothetical protein